MPEPAVPTAPPPGVIIVDTGTPKPPPPPTSQIRAADLSGSPVPIRPGSARAKVHEALQKKVGGEPPAPPPPSSPEPPVPDGRDEERPGAPDSPPESPGVPTEPETPAAPQEGERPGKAGKVSPWKLFDAEKAARARVEKENQELKAHYDELKASIVPEQERQAITDRVQKAEARAKELEEHIKFVDYSRSAEFQEKYQKPYEAAWERAMSELKELTVEDVNGGSRRVTAEDMLELVQLPLPKAREIADNVFGKFADDVMAHRKEIKNLFETQANALDAARKNGVARTEQQKEAVRKWQGEATAAVRKVWEKANAEALADPKHGEYFKPKQGNSEWNQRLAKGAELVDKAFSIDPLNPQLSPQDREAAVRRHAAVRNRAIAYGPLRWENAQLKAELDAAKVELAKYKGTSPPAGGRNGQPTSAGPVKARDSVHEALAKLAH